MKIKLIILVLIIGLSYFSLAQSLQPGFDANEYAMVLSTAFGKYDSLQKRNPSLKEDSYKMTYRSAVVGLDNRWTLWTKNDGKTAIIQIRGTVGSTPSWLANVYAAMLPANGTIQLNDSVKFDYKLAEFPGAAIHTGWLISLGYLAPDIERKLVELNAKGFQNIIIAGHSQGAAIAFLLRSYLYYRIKEGAMPAGLQFKTYCSAAPKPGNLYYAYDLEFINRGGWIFTVINAADWVPETPFSIQQFRDLNKLNPFSDIRGALRNQKWYVKVYANTIYNKFNKSTRKASKRYQKYLGKKVGKQVHKKIPRLEHQEFTNTMNYVRAGTPIILMPDTAYYEQFPNDPNKKAGIWNHHTFEAYYFLLKQYYSIK
jgi:hypothetical protein